MTPTSGGNKGHVIAIDTDSVAIRAIDTDLRSKLSPHLGCITVTHHVACDSLAECRMKNSSAVHFEKLEAVVDGA